MVWFWLSRLLGVPFRRRWRQRRGHRVRGESRGQSRLKAGERRRCDFGRRVGGLRKGSGGGGDGVGSGVY
eukprot:1014373-Ditylum_brightwellii.AAC.1